MILKGYGVLVMLEVQTLEKRYVIQLFPQQEIQFFHLKMDGAGQKIR